MLIHPLQHSCDAQDAAICWQVDQMGLTSQQAKTTDCLMYLGIIRDTYDWSVPPQKLKTKKSKSKLGAAHGMTEGEKWHLIKETGPVTKEIPAEVVM